MGSIEGYHNFNMPYAPWEILVSFLNLKQSISNNQPPHTVGNNHHILIALTELLREIPSKQATDMLQVLISGGFGLAWLTLLFLVVMRVRIVSTMSKVTGILTVVVQIVRINLMRIVYFVMLFRLRTGSLER